MDIDVITDRYRNARFIQRLGIIMVIALSPPAYIYWEQGDQQTAELDQVRSAEQDTRSNFNQAQKKKEELPKIQERHDQIEQLLERAKKYLPDKIEIDEVLGLTAGFEKDLNVQIQKFSPSDKREIQQEDNPSANYREILLSIEVKSDFRKVMSFFDRLVHLDKVTHLRNMEFTAEATPLNPTGEAVGKAQLVLFESTAVK